jgi:hypothetical protein
MRESDVSKTGFASPYRIFEFKVMPMGLCGAPGTFQMLMDEAFAAPSLVDGNSIPFEKFSAVYLDVVCIFSASFPEHLKQIRAVPTRLRERQLYVKPTKCEWAQQEIEFLGHCVAPSGLSITHDKSQAQQCWPAPTSIGELRSLLGTFGFWRQYISGYANIVEPLVFSPAKPLLGGGVRWIRLHLTA